MKKIKKMVTNNITFIKYIFSAGFSFLLDLTLFTIFTFILKNKVASYIMVGTILARIISSFFNYLLNRNAVFKGNKKGKTDYETLFKYYLLVIIQMCVSGLLVSHLYDNISINPTIIKIPVEIVLFMVNYFIQKIFIFNSNVKKFKINLNAACFILAILTTFTLLVKLDINKIILVSNTNNNTLISLILGIFLFFFYKKYLYKYSSNIPFRLLAFSFSLLMVLGYSYDNVGNASLVFGSITFLFISLVKLFCFYKFFNIVINIVYDLLCNYKVKDFIKDNKVIKLFNKHPFIFSAVVIFLCYLPYIIAFYPAIMGYDPANQIKEVMGMHTRYMDSVILLDENMTITNFNPLLHTLLLGGCFKLGHMIGNDNLGLFLYTIIQLTIVISVLSYSISYMKKQGVVNKLLFVVLALYALVPVFPFYAITTNKDTIFCSVILIYCLKLYDLIKNKWSGKNYLILLICSIFVCLLRNNGIYTILLSLPFALIWLKEKRKPLLLVLTGILVFYIGYNKFLLPGLKISNTSIREVLSIPFQQTARYAKEYPQDFTDDDIEVIDKILNYETLAERYNPKLSDPVKNEYNIYTTSEDLKKYFNVWFKGLTKRPHVYLDATINNVYGYFYPNTGKWYIYYKYNTKLREAGFNYHYNNLSKSRSFLSNLARNYPHIPILGLIVNIGFVGWIYFFLLMALIVKKYYKYIPFILPALSFILVCVAGPANTYFRYALPYVMTLPITLCLLYNIFNTKLKSSNEQ